MKGKSIGERIVHTHTKDKLSNNINDVGSSSSSSSLLMIHEESIVEQKQNDNKNLNEYRKISQASVDNEHIAATITTSNNITSSHGSDDGGSSHHEINKSTPLLKGSLTKDKITGAFVWEGEWGMNEEAFNKNIISGFKYRSVSYILKDLGKRRSPRTSLSNINSCNSLAVANPYLNDGSIQPYKIFFNGHFTMLAKTIHSKPIKHAERHIELILEPSHQDESASLGTHENNNKYLVKGYGINIFGTFELRGHYDPDSGALICYKVYAGRLNPALADERRRNPITGPGEILVYTLAADANPISLRLPNSGQFTSKHAHFSKILEIVQTLCKQDQPNNWFSFPIDPIALNSLDYFEIVKRPIDLGTIKRQLEMHMYNNLTEVFDDIRLTFSNALLYNPRGSAVFKAATSMLENFEILIKKRLNVQSSSSSSSSAATATPVSGSKSNTKLNHQPKSSSSSSVENKATTVDTILTNSGKRKRNPKVAYEPEEVPRCMTRSDKSRKRNRGDSESDESHESDFDSDSSHSRDHHRIARNIKARSSFPINGSASTKRNVQRMKQKTITANPLRSETIVKLSKEMIKNSGRSSNYNSILIGGIIPKSVPGITIGKSIFDKTGLYDPIDESNDQDMIASPMISFAVSAFDAADNNPTEALLSADYENNYYDDDDNDEKFVDDISEFVDDDENGDASAAIASPSMRSLSSLENFTEYDTSRDSALEPDKIKKVANSADYLLSPRKKSSDDAAKTAGPDASASSDVIVEI